MHFLDLVSILFKYSLFCFSVWMPDPTFSIINYFCTTRNTEMLHKFAFVLINTHISEYLMSLYTFVFFLQ